MSKVLELVDRIENENVLVPFRLQDVLTLTKIIRLQHEALGFYGNKESYCLYDDINWQDNWIAERVPNKLLKVGTTAKQTLEETNRIASGSEGGEK